ncbi:MAG: hypothetical protein UX57_C0017G0008 [Candidatus Uhrbacteria bacterium GW2011_GWE2_46_68]|uniref:Uncharacterized protein n=2 Tax=Candidatus Uhriibacteriota TaxID=1752732 RepID=A0A0G1Q5U0_9BACT|nr:MAG: hypothetical protein UX45_C0018G0008 [Candidatus Uhrbacteria bacterium GW2011_GWF2_46_218]KKU40416.1 MAG: hypothetical protein UX57_C0017G0008 [Candidatus Uhrbacteria bacterium GW2011_GWE2_46_68]
MKRIGGIFNIKNLIVEIRNFFLRSFTLCVLGHKAGLIGIDGSPLRFHQAEGASDLVNP